MATNFDCLQKIVTHVLYWVRPKIVVAFWPSSLLDDVSCSLALAIIFLLLGLTQLWTC
jgi:uncharacterized membrane protein